MKWVSNEFSQFQANTFNGFASCPVQVGCMQAFYEIEKVAFTSHFQNHP